MILLSLIACSDPCNDDPGSICTVAGTGMPGLGKDGTPAVEAQMYWPSDVTIGPDGLPWVLDWNNHRIVHLVGEGDDRVMKLVTGNAMVGDGPWDAPASTAYWNHPTGIAFDGDGTFVFAAWHNSRVIRIDVTADFVTKVAGNGGRAFSGDGATAQDCAFDLPSAVAFGSDGTLYVADQANQRVRAIGADGNINTIVGNGEPGFIGDGGPALQASLHSDRSQDAQPGGRITIRDDTMYIADTSNHRIRVVDMLAWTIGTYAGSGDLGIPDEGQDALETPMLNPRDVAVAPDGTVYYADTDHSCIRAVVDGKAKTVAGVCGEKGYEGDGGPATEALLSQPYGIDIAEDGTLWITDTFNSAVRRVNPG